jgi:hypothetical protein
LVQLWHSGLDDLFIFASFDGGVFCFLSFIAPATGSDFGLVLVAPDVVVADPGGNPVFNVWHHADSGEDLAEGAGSGTPEGGPPSAGYI